MQVLVPSEGFLKPLNPARSFQLCFFQNCSSHCLFSKTHTISGCDEKLDQKTSHHPNPSMESKLSQKWVILVRKSELNSFLQGEKMQSHTRCLCCFSLGELAGRRDGKLAQVYPGNPTGQKRLGQANRRTVVVTVPRALRSLQKPPRSRGNLPSRHSRYDPSHLHPRSSPRASPPFPGYPSPQPWKEEKFCFLQKVKSSKRVQKRREERAWMRCLAVPPPGSVLP